MKDTLINNINNKTAVVGIFGLGYVGLPLVSRFLEKGFKVVGFDIDQSKISDLKAGKNYIAHIDNQVLLSYINKDQFEPTNDFSKASQVDALVLCVPTPLDRYRNPDLSYVVATIDSVLDHLKTGQLLSLESTTYPGTTEEVIRPKIESKGFKIGEDFFLAYSPEREDPGNPDFTTHTIPKIMGGSTTACKEVGITFYESIINQVVPVSSTQVAEMAKLLENIYRSVNIGLVNELKMVTDRMQLDIHEVIQAASTKPFGFTPFYPGPGIGGHCIPIDPFYLTWKAKEYDIHTHFIELAGEINAQMPQFVVNKITNSLNERNKAIKDAKILLLGLAYKKNVGDLRESPSLDVMELLQERGANLAYSDLHIPTFPRTRRHHFDLESQLLTPETLSQSDCVVILTDHDNFDYDLIQTHSPLVIDTRNCYDRPFENVIKA